MTTGPACRIAIPDWLASPSITHLLDLLGDARFVGGAVRDTLLGRAVGDLDLATPLPPDAVANRLEAGGIRVIPTGIAHGTITAILGDRSVEITTLRRDVETDGRRAVVAFTTDWEADAARRDFTMNTLYLNRTGDVWDPLGCGIEDARAGRVRFVGDAGQRIDEDCLRILRFYRFQAHYGRLPIEPETRLACCRRAAALGQLSGERIRAELFRLLQAESPLPALQVLVEDAIWRKIGLPEPVALNRLARLLRHDAERDPVRRFASLLKGGVTETILRLRLSNEEAERLHALVSGTIPEWDAGTVAHHRAIYEQGRRYYRDLALLAVARGRDPVPLAAHLDAAAAWQIPTFPIRGRDLVTLGLSPGPAVSETLRQVEDWWAAGDFSADHDACLAEARKVLTRSDQQGLGSGP
jgi:poly(A) polymerase